MCHYPVMMWLVFSPSPRSVGLFGEGLGLLTLGGLSEEPDSILKQNSSNYTHVGLDINTCPTV